MKRPGPQLQGLRTGGGRKPNPASRCTEAPTLPKGRARGRPQVQPSVPPHGPQPGSGPGPLRGGGLERDVRCRAQPGGCPGAGRSQSLLTSPTTATLARGSPTHPGAGSFSPGFPHRSSAGARAPAAWRVQTPEAPAPPPPREPSPAFRVPGPHFQARPGPAQQPGPRVRGAAAVRLRLGSYLLPRGSGPGPMRGEPGVAGGRRRADG